jgi:hypothetical protein
MDAKTRTLLSGVRTEDGYRVCELRTAEQEAFYTRQILVEVTALSIEGLLL